MKGLNLLLMGLLALNVACSKSANTTGNSSTLNTDINALAKCSPMNVYNNNINTGFTANIQTLGYVNNPSFMENVQVKINNMPQNFIDGKGVIRFFRYQMSGNAAPISDDNELMVDITPRGFVQGASRGKRQVSYAELNAFGGVDQVFLAVGVGSSAHILEMAYYNENGQYQGSSYGLLPPYTASPDLHSQSMEKYGPIAAQEMRKYHPLQNEGRGQDDTYYKQVADSRFCFAGLETNHP